MHKFFLYTTFLSGKREQRCMRFKKIQNCFREKIYMSKTYSSQSIIQYENRMYCYCCCIFLFFGEGVEEQQPQSHTEEKPGKQCLIITDNINFIPNSITETIRNHK